MRNGHGSTASLAGKHRGALYAPLALLLLFALTGCRSSVNSNDSASSGIIIVNAPAAGIVRRVLVNEGTKVDAGTPIVEIAVESPATAATVVPSPGESAESRAVSGVRTAQGEIDAARAEVVRHEAEVQRLTPLVASGEASQAQLDGERALYERAQQRLQQAQDAEKRAQDGLLLARQPGRQPSATAAATPVSREQLVAATPSSAGIVRVISVRVGERVALGQPLVTLRSEP